MKPEIQSKIDPQEKKKLRIITAAIKVFAKEGLDGGKIADIAIEAGIGKGTVYEYFRSKDEIFLALMVHMFDEIIAGYSMLAESDEDTVIVLERIFDITFDVFDTFVDETHAESCPIVMEITAQGMRSGPDTLLGGVLREKIRSSYRTLEPLIQRAMDEGLLRAFEPADLAFLIFSTLDGLALHCYMQYKQLDFNRLRSQTKDLFLRGILADGIEARKDSAQ